MKRFSIMALFIASTAWAQAHAFLDHADPPVGCTLAQSPPQVKIWFTREIVKGPSQIRVFDAYGREVDERDAKVDAADEAVMTVSLPKLPPGIYQVKWSAVALDTHHTKGGFTFEVAQK